MPKPLRQLTPDLSAAHRLGAELRRFRRDRGHTHKSLGDKVHVSKSMIGAIELGARISTAAVMKACDDELGAGGALVELWMAASKSRARPGRRARSVPHAASTPLDRAVAHVEHCWRVRLNLASAVLGHDSLGAPTDEGTWVRVCRLRLDEIGFPNWAGAEAYVAPSGTAALSWKRTLIWRGDEEGTGWQADEAEFVEEPPDVPRTHLGGGEPALIPTNKTVGFSRAASTRALI